MADTEPRPDGASGACASVDRPMAPGVLAALLRSAVALQAEGLLRTVGAVSGAWGSVLDRSAWIERDARDLSALSAAAVAAGARLPAGMDCGAGDPAVPDSIVEGLLAHHEALVGVLRHLAAVPPTRPDPGDEDGDVAEVDDGDPEPWRDLVAAVLQRREEDILLLRATGVAGHLPQEQVYRRGQPPRHR